jgi:hypothetical protein
MRTAETSFPRDADMIASSEMTPLSVLGHLFNQHAIPVYPR